MSKRVTVTFTVSDGTDEIDLFRVLDIILLSAPDYDYYLPELSVHILGVEMNGVSEEAAAPTA